MLKKKTIVIIILIAFTALKIVIYFPLKKVSYEIIEMSKYVEKLKSEAIYLGQFEDSVIFGNSARKEQILKSISSVADLKELRAKNQLELEDKIAELELVPINAEHIRNKYWIYNGIDDLTNIAIVVTLILFGIAITRRS